MAIGLVVSTSAVAISDADMKNNTAYSLELADSQNKLERQTRNGRSTTPRRASRRDHQFYYAGRH